MNPTEIKEFIAKGRTEKAVQGVRELSKNTELEDSGIGISRRQRKFKKDQISGILSYDEINREEAKITHSIFQLLEEYEILQIRQINNGFEQLKTELSALETPPELESAIIEISDIAEKTDIDELEDTSKEQKKERLGKVGAFLNQLADPDSKAGKVIAMVKNGIDIAQNIATSYNSVAEWVGLPVVPRLFLKN